MLQVRSFCTFKENTKYIYFLELQFQKKCIFQLTLYTRCKGGGDDGIRHIRGTISLTFSITPKFHKIASANHLHHDLCFHFQCPSLTTQARHSNFLYRTVFCSSDYFVLLYHLLQIYTFYVFINLVVIS